MIRAENGAILPYLTGHRLLPLLPPLTGGGGSSNLAALFLLAPRTLFAQIVRGKTSSLNREEGAASQSVKRVYTQGRVTAVSQ